MKNGYLVKLVLPVGHRVLALEFSTRHILASLAFGVALLAGVTVAYVGTLRHEQQKVDKLRNLTIDQRQRLRQIDTKAAQLDTELRMLQAQNEAIRRLIDGGAGPAVRLNPARAKRRAPSERRQSLRGGDAFARVAARIARLHTDSARVRGEGEQLRHLALHVLNMRRLEDIARARVLAALPSLNPAGAAAAVLSGYGWRGFPWSESHQGVDLDAGYGDAVRAAAAGTVVSAGWDGGFGLKVDIDHGNGYHTWYAHLSRLDVQPGQRVGKAETIARVGSTGESTGPHLHYQIMLDGSPIDPTPYLTGVPDKVLASLK